MSYILSGLVIGGVYGILALGLLLTYRCSRVFNFGHAAIAYFVSRLFYYMAVTEGWNRIVSAVVSVFVGAPIVGILLWLILFRHLANRSALVRVASTIGVLVALPAIANLIFGEAAIYNVPGLAGVAPHAYRVFGVPLNMNQILILIIAAAVALIFGLVLRFTEFGLVIRAVVDSPETTGLTGTNPTLVSAATWAIGSMLAGVAGILVAPIVTLTNGTFQATVLAAFAAVVIARLRSLPMAFVGGIAVGLIQQSSIKYVPNGGIWSGLTIAMPFIILVVVLVVYSYRENLLLMARAGQVAIGESGPGQGQLVGRAALSTATPAQLARVKRGMFVVFAAAMLALGLSSGFWGEVIATGLILGIIFFSFNILTGETGAISVTQAGLAGLGAIAMGQLTNVYHWPILLDFLIAGAIGALGAWLIGVISLRLGDLYFALATVGFALLIDNMVLNQPRYINLTDGVAVPILKLGGIGLLSGRTAFLFLAVVVALGAGIIVNLRRSRSGLAFAAVRAGEDRAGSLGLNATRLKLWAFIMSGAFAGAGGALYAMMQLRSLPQDFVSTVGFVWFAVMMTIGVRSIGGAIASGVLATVLPVFVSIHLSARWLELPTALFGIGAILLARQPDGGAATMSRQLFGLGQRLKGLRPFNHQIAAAGPLPSGSPGVSIPVAGAPVAGVPVAGVLQSSAGAGEAEGSIGSG